MIESRRMLLHAWHDCNFLPYCMGALVSVKTVSCMQEAVEDMKQVASVTPRKARQEEMRTPETRKRKRAGAGAGRLRRRLFHSPKKRKKQNEVDVQKEKPVPVRESDSEDRDIFHDKYKLRRQPLSPVYSVGKSPNGDPEEDDEDEEEEESPTKPDDHEPLEASGHGPRPDGNDGGMTLAEKQNILEPTLLALLTESSSKFLGLFMLVRTCMCRSVQIGSCQE